MKVKILLVILLFSPIAFCNLLDTSGVVKSRQKRWLIWSDAGVNWVQFIFGLGIPMEVKKNSITLGTVMKAFYLLPTNSTVYTNPSIDYPARRRKRSTNRWTAYEGLANFLGRYNNGDGKSCLLRSICEVSHTPLEESSGILSEIVQAVLRPSTTQEDIDQHTDLDYFAAENLGRNRENCEVLYPECKLNLMDQFSKFI